MHVAPNKKKTLLVCAGDSPLQVTVGRAATLEIIECRLDGGQISSVIDVELCGEGARVDIRSAVFCSGEDQLQSTVTVNHLASNTTSQIVTKAVVAGCGRVIQRGLITVARGLSGCVGTEHMSALLLSTAARADLAPDLKIESADVQCNHGAAISGLDDESLYYLMSRGLSLATARELVTFGFFGEILEKISDMTDGKAKEIFQSRLQCALTQNS